MGRFKYYQVYAEQLNQTKHRRIKKKLTQYGTVFLYATITLFFMYLFFVLPTKHKKADLEYQISFIDKKEYFIKIESPKTKDNKVNQEIKSWISKEKESIKKEAIRAYSKTKKQEVYRLDYTIIEYNNVMTIQLRRGTNLKTIHYQIELEQIVNVKDMFLKPLKANDALKRIITEHLLEYAGKSQINLSYHDTILSLEQNEDVLEHSMFTKNGLSLVIEASRIPNINVNVSMLIPYEEIRNTLQMNYIASADRPKKEVDSKEEKPSQDYTGKKLLAFTFDDGPGKDTTPALLDGLKARGVKATFFVLGTRSEQNPEIVARTVKEGHEIGSHTYNHMNLKVTPDVGIHDQIKHTNDILEQITGVRPNLLRPPYGSYDNRVKDISNMAFILWNRDTEDWKWRDANQIYDKTLDTIQDGDIVLFHDIYKASVDAALHLIDKLKEDGYIFVTVSELARAKGIPIALKDHYYYFK